MSDHETFELGPLVLQCGVTLPAAHLAYKTNGTLAPDRGNVILYPTSYGAHHTDIDWLIGPSRPRRAICVQSLCAVCKTRLMPNAVFRPIHSIWGHRAGNPIQCPEDEAMLRSAVRELLG